MIDETLNAYELLRQQIVALAQTVDEESIAVQPRGLPNHVAWTLGHLIVSCQAMGEELGIPHWLDDRWDPLFGQGTQPVPKRTAYPPKEFLLQAYDDAAGRVVDRIRKLGLRGMRASLPDENYRAVLPTVGHAVISVLVGHTAFHLGQLSAWKRALEK
ncbi:MAG: DinB family protein [Acidobacteria bacterium]|nr:DinB family protein [Acidobacteriota bacterium]